MFTDGADTARGAGALAVGLDALGAAGFGVGACGVGGRLTDREPPEGRILMRASAEGTAKTARASTPREATATLPN